MFIRNAIVLSSLAIAALMAGCCCGPGAGGCGSCVTDCNDCDGGCSSGSVLAGGPLQHFTQMRKSMVCGGGCGEVYYGEWQSTPPDACDPCCGSEFVGGAVPCTPFCWRPGLLKGFFSGLYGQRFCEGCGNSFEQCGCGFLDSSCGGGCGSGNSYDSGEQYIEDGGCSTCNDSSKNSSNHRIAHPAKVKTNHRTARANAMRRDTTSRSNVGTRYR